MAGSNAASSAGKDPDTKEGLPPSMQETLKTLKRLGYPDREKVAKASTLIPKVIQALTKRLGKLEECKTDMQQSSSKSTIFEKILDCTIFRPRKINDGSMQLSVYGIVDQQNP